MPPADTDASHDPAFWTTLRRTLGEISQARVDSAARSALRQRTLALGRERTRREVAARLARPGLPVIAVPMPSAGAAGSLARAQRLLRRGGFAASVWRSPDNSLALPPETTLRLERLGEWLQLGRATRARIAKLMTGGPAETIVLRFKWPSVGQLDLPLRIVTLPRPKAPPRAATFASRADWLEAAGVLPTAGGSHAVTRTMPFGVATELVARKRRRGTMDSTWVVTPDATWAGEAISLAREALAAGRPVTLTLSRPGLPAVSLPVAAAERRYNGRRHGFHLKAGSAVDWTKLAAPAPRSDPLAAAQVHADFFWSERATHLVAPTGDTEIDRRAYRLDAPGEAALRTAIAKGGGAANVAVVETKTPVYRFFLDIDQDQALLAAFPAFAAFKAAQLAAFAGPGETWEPLGRMLGLFYPAPGGAPTRILASSRSGGAKLGRHLICPDLLLSNDEAVGRLLAGQLERLAAEALVPTQTKPLGRFLTAMLQADGLHLGHHALPLALYVRPEAALALEGVETIKGLAAVARDGIRFALKADGAELSEADNRLLVDFALRSMGELSLQRRLDQAVAAVNLPGRARALYRLARRCRWEIVRRARCFDQSVYGPTMGLRMLGTIKPGDPASRYLPAGPARALKAADIAAHSIRAPGAAPSHPSPGMASLIKALGIGPAGPAHGVRSLDGMLMAERIEGKVTLRDLTFTLSIGAKASPSILRSGHAILSGQGLSAAEIERRRATLRPLSPAVAPATARFLPDRVLRPARSRRRLDAARPDPARTASLSDHGADQ